MTSTTNEEIMRLQRLNLKLQTTKDYGHDLANCLANLSFCVQQCELQMPKIWDETVTVIDFVADLGSDESLVDYHKNILELYKVSNWDNKTEFFLWIARDNITTPKAEELYLWATNYAINTDFNMLERSRKQFTAALDQLLTHQRAYNGDLKEEIAGEFCEQLEARLVNKLFEDFMGSILQ